MRISDLSLNRPVLAIVLNIIIVLFGIIGFRFLGVRDYPAIDPPNINVRTTYPGANADVIESQITEPVTTLKRQPMMYVIKFLKRFAHFLKTLNRHQSLPRPMRAATQSCR